MDNDEGQARHPPDLLSVAEVACMLRVSKMTVYRLIHSQELVAIKIGKSFRVPRAAVSTLLGEDHTELWQSS